MTRTSLIKFLDTNQNMEHTLIFQYPTNTQGFSPRSLKYMRKFAEVWPERELVQRCVALETPYLRGFASWFESEFALCRRNRRRNCKPQLRKMNNLLKNTSRLIAQQVVGQLQKPIVPQPVAQLKVGLLLIEKAQKNAIQS